MKILSKEEFNCCDGEPCYEDYKALQARVAELEKVHNVFKPNRNAMKKLATFERALEKACKHLADIKAACPSDAGFDMVKVEKCECTVTCDGITDECYKLYFIEEAKGESE